MGSAGAYMGIKKWALYIYSTAFIVLVTLHFLLAFNFAKTSVTRDFAAFYCAGSIVIDSSLRDVSVYDPVAMEKAAIGLGLDVKPEKYLYSIPIAYLFSPLTLLSYDDAKLAFLIISFILYFTAIVIILKTMLPIKKWFSFFAIVPWIWLPFLINQQWIQSNSLLLLWIALGVYLAMQRKDLSAGFMFGIAILMKVFPIILVLLIGIKNWRIFAASLATASLFFVFPGSFRWIEVLMYTNHPNSSPIVHISNALGPFWRLAFQGAIFGLSAVLVYRFKRRDYLLISAFGVISSLLISPVVGAYYYTLLILCFVYLYSAREKLPIWMKLIGIISFLIFGFTNNYYTLNFIALLLLWFTFAFLIEKTAPAERIDV
jgi:hypothetical protein